MKCLVFLIPYLRKELVNEFSKQEFKTYREKSLGEVMLKVEKKRKISPKIKDFRRSKRKNSGALLDDSRWRSKFDIFKGTVNVFSGDPPFIVMCPIHIGNLHTFVRFKKTSDFMHETRKLIFFNKNKDVFLRDKCFKVCDPFI